MGAEDREDRYVIHKCLDGESAAFGLLVDKYKAMVYALSYSELLNFQDAEDVTQEAFTTAYQELHSLRREDSFSARLYAITSNLCKNLILLRSKRPDRGPLAVQAFSVLDNDSVDSNGKRLMRGSLREALDSLPDAHRQVLVINRLGGISMEGIARFLSMSRNNVLSCLRRAQAELKEEMIATMDRTFERQRLGAVFTLCIVEMVKPMQMRPA